MKALIKLTLADSGIDTYINLHYIASMTPSGRNNTQIFISNNDRPIYVKEPVEEIIKRLESLDNGE